MSWIRREVIREREGVTEEETTDTLVEGTREQELEARGRDMGAEEWRE